MTMFIKYLLSIPIAIMPKVHKYNVYHLGIIILLLSFFRIALASNADNEMDMISRRGPNDVMISGNSVWMPVNRILLIRKDTRIGAIKFIRDGFWITKRFRYADYEEYCCNDENGNLAGSNINQEKRTASALFIISPLFLGNFEVRCGPIKLFWSGGRNVHFYKGNQNEGDYGIELAPTPWTDISQVNLSDPLIKWYRYDGKRKRVNIPIDTLWNHEKRSK